MLSRSCAASPEGESSRPELGADGGQRLLAGGEMASRSSGSGLAAQRFALDQADEVGPGGEEVEVVGDGAGQDGLGALVAGQRPRPSGPDRLPDLGEASARARPGRARPWSRRSSPGCRGRRRPRPRPRSGWLRRNPFSAKRLLRGIQDGRAASVRVAFLLEGHGVAPEAETCLLAQQVMPRPAPQDSRQERQRAVHRASRATAEAPTRCAAPAPAPLPPDRAPGTPPASPPPVPARPSGATFRNSGRYSSHRTRMVRARGLTVFSSCSRTSRCSSSTSSSSSSVELHHVVVDPAVERAGLVQHVRHAVRHAGAEVPAGPAQHHDDARRSCTRSSGCPRPRSPRPRRSFAPRTGRPPGRRRTACRRWRRRARCCR